ncbi:ABC transporter permease [Nocardioides endophyticus]|uniref:ABC transporter permease n=1 Tax=Nocardioides endophyticus TaxID=1353775 RepID=A0ABP8YIS6_9ACTN
MNTDVAPLDRDAHADDAGPSPASRSRRHRFLASLSPANISVLYLAVAIVILFSLWIPDLFLTSITLKTLLNNNAIPAFAALALLLPLAAGLINLAVGAQVGAASMLTGWLLVNQGYGIWITVAICLGMGIAVGIISGYLIVYWRIDSFIATLGISSLLAAFTSGLSGGRQILGMPERFAELGSSTLFGLTYPVWILLVVALVLWYFLEKTPAGRRIYAVGGNIDAAKLSGVRTSRVIILSLVIGGAISAGAGVLLTAQLANADPTLGPGYLLIAFTATFFGATQFGGRFNVWGTVLAVYVIAAGVKGLQLAGAPVWIPDAFNGAALLVAVAMATFKRSGRSSFWDPISRLLPWRRSKRTAFST